MMRTLLCAAIALMISACAEGSTTTQRPAIDKPVISPAGTFYDAVTAARLNEPARMKKILSTRFVHHAVLPNIERLETQDETEYFAENIRLENQLKPFASIVERLYARYTGWIAQKVRGRFIETDKPSYDLRFKDSYGTARGPNTAKLKVNLYSKADSAAAPEVLEISFVQEGDTWRIDGFKPDPLFGEFIR